MAIRIYAAESIVWRTVGLVESRLRGFSWDQPNASQTMLKAVEEFATECSIVKVYCSEMLDYVVDEGVQIHGGYGFHQDYAVERSYRDTSVPRHNPDGTHNHRGSERLRPPRSPTFRSSRL